VIPPQQAKTGLAGDPGDRVIAVIGKARHKSRIYADEADQERISDIARHWIALPFEIDASKFQLLCGHQGL
jgi:hypothetical protein